MPAKLTLYPTRGASRHFIFREGESPEAGREPSVPLFLDDPRVSGRHACFRWDGSGWALQDGRSKNGTFINGLPADGATLESGDWVSFGGLLARFERVSDKQVSALEKERVTRLQTSVELALRLAEEDDPGRLLHRLMESVLEVAGAERGIVLLLSPDGSLRARVASGFSAATRPDNFDGSFGAIQRVLETGESVVATDAKTDAYLGSRPSVIEMEIGALACVPLTAEGKVAGLIYVDGKKRGGLFTDLDLETLMALADHAALVVAGMRIDSQIRELLGGGGALSPEAPGFLLELERRVEEIARG